MKQEITCLLRKAYNKLFCKKTHRTILERKQDGTIHIYGDVIVHGNICGEGQSILIPLLLSALISD